jgi:hypothetical protein
MWGRGTPPAAAGGAPASPDPRCRWRDRYAQPANGSGPLTASRESALLWHDAEAVHGGAIVVVHVMTWASAYPCLLTIATLLKRQALPGTDHGGLLRHRGPHG